MSAKGFVWCVAFAAFALSRGLLLVAAASGNWIAAAGCLFCSDIWHSILLSQKGKDSDEHQA